MLSWGIVVILSMLGTLCSVTLVVCGSMFESSRSSNGFHSLLHIRYYAL
ncbi:hypothetical protein XF_1386 [Xylella fastidiosa 9a5c]|uniref:Uncharacterized protein n=1 Tax=Xylella fastidiosa (strain 9a5c) TaxID=160492 RepID=Q9PDJ3_XYLFA|nr:hypothetical protein XF_1386 [Xylella fastidiosa 9a5c]